MNGDLSAAPPAAISVVVTRRLPPAVEQAMAARYRVVANADDRGLDGGAILARCHDATAVALVCTPTERLDAAVIAALPDSLRLIATYSVGHDHIDLAAAAARGLAVTNTPDVLTESTADLALLCLLGAVRRAHEGDRLIREGRWTRWSPTELLGFELGGKRLGIVGLGRIGRAVARRALGFGMTILYTDRTAVGWDGPGSVTHVPALDALLPQVDVLSLHAPGAPGEPPLLTADRLAQMRPGAVVVNTARGSLIDDGALIAALETGHIAAAGLDVFANEPALHPGYARLPNAFLMPHLGSATREARDAMGFRVIANLDRFLAGELPVDRVV